MVLFKKHFGFFLLFWSGVFNPGILAQIIYTDIEDVTPSASYTLDLNNDATADFVFHFGKGIMCQPIGKNAYCGKSENGNYLAWALDGTKKICDTNAIWYDSTKAGLLARGTTNGYWLGAKNKYLALKLIVGAKTYFGWVRIDIAESAGSFTIKDYAYQSNANMCIEAGQTTAALKSISRKTNNNIFPNPFSITATIKTNSNLTNGSLIVYNAFGQVVKKINHLSGQSFTINRENLASGMYVVKIMDRNLFLGDLKMLID